MGAGDRAAGTSGISAPGNNTVLLVGNFGDGRIHAFDATSGSGLGELRDPDGQPIQIDKVWALWVGNNGAGGVSTAVYFTAGPFGESHGLFGSLTTAAPGSPEGPAEAQWVQANVDVVQLDLAQLGHDISSGAPPAPIDQDTTTRKADTAQLVDGERDFSADLRADAA